MGHIVIGELRAGGLGGYFLDFNDTRNLLIRSFSIKTEESCITNSERLDLDLELELSSEHLLGPSYIVASSRKRHVSDLITERRVYT